MKFGMGIGLKNARNYNADYALEFNGTDEYLQIALPSELITNGTFETGTNTFWSAFSTATYNDTELGKTGNYCCKSISTGVQGIRAFSLLTIGKKYKLSLRYKGTVGLRVGNDLGTMAYYLLSATSEWCTVTKVFTATTTALYLCNDATGTVWIDDISVKEDQGFDLNKDQEQILHSKNWDFERTLGTELASGTVTIGSKYVVTAGTVEGNTIGTEFLAVTDATTLDASNKVKPIPNLVSNGTFDSDTVWTKGTGWAISGNVATHTAGTASSLAQSLPAIINPRKYRTVFTVSGRTAGSVYIQLSGGGGGNGTLRTADGTYSQDLVAGTASQGALYFICSADFDGSVDNVHIYEIPEWTATGNHTQNLSILDKSGATGQSMLISASGAGDSTTNHVKLPSADIESVVSGKKYTIQGEARLDASSLSYTNSYTSDFSSTEDGFVTLSGRDVLTPNTDSIEGEDDVLKCVSNASPSYHTINKTLGFNLLSTRVYKFSFKYYIPTGMQGTNIYTFVNGASVSVTSVVKGTWQNYVTYYKPTSNTADFRIYVDTITLVNQELYIKDVLIDEATAVDPITLTARLGTKSVTSSALSIVAGTFTKFVLNFEATASEQSQDLKLYLSGAGNVFVDKLSLTQAYDVAILSKKRNLSHLNSDWLLATGYGSIDYNGYDITIQSGGAVNLSLRSSPTLAESTILTGNTSLTWFDIIGVLNRTDTNGTYNRSNVLGQITTKTLGAHGKVILSRNLVIGTWSTGGTDSFNGLISHLQIIRFENISLSSFNSAITGLQYPTGGGAEEVLRLTFQDGTSFANCVKDYSPKNHSISNPGSTMDLTNRKRVV